MAIQQPGEPPIQTPVTDDKGNMTLPWHLWCVMMWKKIGGGSAMSLAWGSITGVISAQADLVSALAAKVTGNAAITGATHTKITYDTKGLVTSGSDLVAADVPNIAESQVTNLVTDLAAKVPTSRSISTTAPLTGGGDLSADRTLAVSTMVGDSGAGGSRGVVPAPAAGDAAAGKFLKADGTFAVPSGGTGTVTHTAGVLTAHAVVVGNGSDDEKVLAALGGSGQVLKSQGAGSDPVFADIVESMLVLADNTTDNVTSSAHGFAPKSPADATKFLNGAATPAYAQPKDSDLSTSDITTNDVSITKHGFAPKAPNDSTKFLNGVGAYAVPPGTGTGTVTHTSAALAAHAVVVGNGGSDAETIASTGTAGQYLRSGGASADPAMASIAESEVTNLVSDLALKAPLASPALTGTPTAPTASALTGTTQIATTSYVDTADALKANLASPTFTGTPAAPTATTSDNSTKIATTAYVQANVSSITTGALPLWLRNNPDATPTSAGTLDDEFTDANFNDNTKWTIVSSGTAAVKTQTQSWLKMTHASNGNLDALQVIYQAMPAGTWEVVAKLNNVQASTGNWIGGIVIADSAAGKYLVLVQRAVGGAYSYDVFGYSNLTTFSTSFFVVNALSLGNSWLKVKDDGTNFIWSVSLDGVTFTTIGTHSRTAFLTTPSKVGIVINAQSDALTLSCDYFRRTI